MRNLQFFLSLKGNSQILIHNNKQNTILESLPFHQGNLMRKSIHFQVLQNHEGYSIYRTYIFQALYCLVVHILNQYNVQRHGFLYFLKWKEVQSLLNSRISQRQSLLKYAFDLKKYSLNEHIHKNHSYLQIQNFLQNLNLIILYNS